MSCLTSPVFAVQKLLKRAGGDLIGDLKRKHHSLQVTNSLTQVLSWTTEQWIWFNTDITVESGGQVDFPKMHPNTAPNIKLHLPP